MTQIPDLDDYTLGQRRGLDFWQRVNVPSILREINVDF